MSYIIRMLKNILAIVFSSLILVSCASLRGTGELLAGLTTPSVNIELIVTSGGVAQYASLNRVVFREIDGTRHVAGLSLKSIRDGDMIYQEVMKEDITVVYGSQVIDDYQELLRSIPPLPIFRPF